MRTAVLVAMLVPLLVPAGCARRTAKKPPADDPAGATPAPAPLVPDRGRTKDAQEGTPNWLNDPRFKKEQADPAEARGPGNKQPWGITPPKGGWQGAPLAKGGQPGAAPPGAPGNAGQAPAPGLPAPPGVGVLQPRQPPGNSPATAPKFSPVSRQDMFDLQVFIHDASLAAGKMPAPALIYQALVAARSPAAELVKDGSVTLTGVAQRDAIWAFETRAVLQGGFAVSQNGVETLTAEQLTARLGK
jgi:hypothetical protein